MKKILSTLTAAICVLACMFSFTACNFGDNGNTHTTHNWSATYTQDGDRHYQTCDGCNERNYGEHEYGADGLCVCGKTEKTTIPVTGIVLSENELILDIGDTVTLTATVFPENATNKTVIWSSSDPEVASVDGNGNVTALAGGSAYISATAEISETCRIFVNTPVESIESISLDRSNLELGLFESERLSCSYTPETAFFTGVAWSSSDPDVAIVDYEGVVTGCAEGEAVITATTENGKTAQCNITVSRRLALYLSGDELSYGVGGIGSILDTDIVIPSEYRGLPVTTIHDGAFSGKSNLTSVTIGNGVISIGNFAFKDCTGLTDITIPDSVTSIGERTFYGCTGLTSATIGNGVISIGNFAFKDCTGLASITIPDSVTSIGKTAFYGCSGLTSVVIPDNVQSIGSSAFEDCTGLTSVTIGNGVTSIGGSAFFGCAKLTSIIIPDSVTPIGERMFTDCTGLTSVTIGNSLTSIGERMFTDCTGLTSVVIPDNVQSIGSSAFSGCTGLTSITIPDGVTSIGYYAFENCTGLTSIIIPDSVTSIGTAVFQNCIKLISITIPNSVTSIGAGAYAGCDELTSITFNGTKVQWEAITKGQGWDDYTGNYTVHCTDGDITKS